VITKQKNNKLAKSKYKNIKRAKFKLKSGKPKHKNRRNPKNSFFVWISPHYCSDFAVLKFGFPRFFRKYGKSKQKIGEIKKKIGEIQTKNLFFIVWISQILYLDFPDFCLDFAFFVWISPVLNFLGRQSK
jgi:hypothetical protein